MAFKAARKSPVGAIPLARTFARGCAARGNVRQAFEGFARKDDGALIIFGLFIFVLMLMIGGLAIDVMRAENERTRLQNTLDRASLAAADLDQSLDPNAVFNDYVAKAGYGGLGLVPVVSQEGTYPDITSRSITVKGVAPIRTLFLGFLGIDELDAIATTTAAEVETDIEISLVLDVSGSMGSNQKLQNMQDAAKKFIDQVLAASTKGSISISIVPYSTQVAAGAKLLSRYNVTNEQASSTCVDFRASDFDTASLSNTDLLQRTGHFDRWTGYNDGRRPTPRDFVCRTDPAFSIQAWSDNANALKTQIEAFTADGNTSIDVAVKWGAALLDPGSQPVLSSMVASKDVSEDFEGRPYAYNRPNTKKYIVVMTDGINTEQFFLNPGYQNGPSTVFYDAASRMYSVLATEPGDKDGDGTPGEAYFISGDPAGTMPRNYDSRPAGGANAVRLSYPELWARMTVKSNARYNHYAQDGRNSTYDSWFSNVVGEVPRALKDTRLKTICSAAKAKNVTIFSIGFEVTDASAAVMQNCASTVNHFYRVSGKDISYAFTSIANQINQLRLTQ